MSSIPTPPTIPDASSDQSKDLFSGNGHTPNYDVYRRIADHNYALVLSINRLTFVMRDELREIKENLRPILQISESLAHILDTLLVHSPDFDHHSISGVSKDSEQPLTKD